jgi:hypothetical protein
MSDKIKELLAVLDLPIKSQRKWVAKWASNNLPRTHGVITSLSLADLAFRLRDEAAERPILFKQAREIVVTRKMEAMRPYADSWFIEAATPIRWIIAALIAKELANEPS